MSNEHTTHYDDCGCTSAGFIAEINKLQKHIDSMSCCCAGCTKHNLNISAPTDTERLDWILKKQYKVVAGEPNSNLNGFYWLIGTTYVQSDSFKSQRDAIDAAMELEK